MKTVNLMPDTNIDSISKPKLHFVRKKSHDFTEHEKYS